MLALPQQVPWPTMTVIGAVHTPKNWTLFLGKRLRKCEAYDEGLLLPSEVDLTVEQDGEDYIKRRTANAKAWIT